MRQKVAIPLGIIQKADQEGWLLSLSYFVQLKSLYNNNTHYNFSVRSLAKRLNCSPTTLGFHYKVLLNKGFIREYNSNVTFIGIKKLIKIAKDEQISYKFFYVPVVNKNRETILRAYLCYNPLHSQEWHIKRVAELKSLKRRISSNNHVSSAEYKRYKKLIKFYGNDFESEKRTDYTSLSCKSVGKITNRHEVTACRMKKIWESYSIISQSRKFEVIMPNASFKDFLAYKRRMRDCNIYGRVFFINNSLVKQLSNEVSFIDTTKVHLKSTSLQSCITN